MDELRRNFDTEASDSIKHPSRYARNFLEYCCFRALSLSSQVTGHLGDKNFRRLTYDMMLAWEAPGAASQSLVMVRGLDLFIVKLVMFDEKLSSNQIDGDSCLCKPVFMYAPLLLLLLCYLI